MTEQRNITNKNRMINLPIILQNLIFEYSGNYRTQMNKVLQELKQHANQREYKKQIIRRLKNDVVSVRQCTVCWLNNRIYCVNKYLINNSRFVCSKKCLCKLFSNEPNTIYFHHRIILPDTEDKHKHTIVRYYQSVNIF